MTYTHPKVSVVCAWYNRASHIQETLDSLLIQDYPNFDITVVNDGSQDQQVRQILESYDDHRLRVIHQDNTGFTRAIRRAIDESDGEYIAIQGAGDTSSPTRLTRQVALLSKSAGIAAVGTGCVQVAAGKKLRRRYFSPTIECTPESLRTNMPFVHGTTMFRRKCYLAAGGYDTRFKYCSDWDLFFRVLEQGRIVGEDQPLYEQRMFADGFSFSPTHKFKQIWFRERAINRSVESRALLEYAEEIVNQIHPENPNNIKYTIIAAIKSIAKGDIRNSVQWWQLAIKQFGNFRSELTDKIVNYFR